MKLFLSFNSKDMRVASALRDALVRLDPLLDIFFSPVSLGQGFWLPKLAEGIRAADAFLLLMAQSGPGPWQEMEYFEALDRRVKDERFALVPVIVGAANAPGLPFLRQLNWVEIAPAFEDDAVRKVLAALRGEVAAPVSPLWKLVHPYRGLEAMTEANADYFYGRTAETEATLAVLAERPGRLPILMGPSGVGKSSVAQAGVLSALKAMRWPRARDDPADVRPWPEPFRDSRNGWAWLIMRPGDEPLYQLAAAFSRLWIKDPTDPDRGALARRWADDLRAGKNSLSDLIQATQEKLTQSDGAAPTRVLLYVDQGEELYAGAARLAPPDARRFSEVLAAGLKDRRLMAFASLRADYFDRLQADTPLFEAHELVSVAPLTHAGLNEVVTRPPRALGVRFEDERLPGRIVEASADERGATLPLLSYLLTDMWSAMMQRGDAMLRLPVQAIDVGGVLAETAEKFLKANPDRETPLRRLLALKLTLVPAEGDPIRRTARRSECSTEEWSLAEELAEYPWRLVTISEREAAGQTGTDLIVAEVAHEALLTAWPRLAGWLRDEREFLVFKGEAERAERRWRGMQRSDRALLASIDLDRAVEWMPKRRDDLPAEVGEFIQASIAFDRSVKEKQLRFQRRVSVGAAAFAVVLALLGAFAGWSWREAAWQQARAETALRRAQASLWIANARSDLRDGRIVSAIGEAAKAFEQLPDETSRSALASALLQLSPHLRAGFDFGADAVEAIGWLGEDSVAFVSKAHAASLQAVAPGRPGRSDVRTEWPVPRIERASDGNRATVRTMRPIGPDRIMAVLDDGTIALIERGAAAARVATPMRDGANGPVTLQAGTHAAAIGRSGTLLVAAANGADVVVIECTLPADAQAALACMPGAPTNVRGRAVAINADETRFAVADETDTVSIFDRAGRRLGEPIKVGGTPVSLGWAAAGDWLAVGSINGAVTIIDPAVPDAPIAQASLGGPVTALAWRPAGLQLAFACEGRDICLWQAAAGARGAEDFAPIRRLAGHGSSATSLAWSPAGDRIASAAADGTIRISSLAQNTDAGFALYAESRAQFTAVATSPGGQSIAAGARDGTIRIFDAGSGALARTVRPAFESGIVALAYAPSGLLAAAHESDGITLVPSDTRQRVRALAAETDLGTRLVFADDRTLVLPRRSDNRIALIDLAAPESAPRTIEPIGRSQAPFGVAVDPAARKLFASYADADGAIHGFDLATLKASGPLNYALAEKRDPVAAGSLSISHDGRWLAVSGGDNLIRVYDLRANSAWRALAMDRAEPRNVAFSPDGTKLAALAADNRVYVWRMREEGAERYAAFKAVPDRPRVLDEEMREAVASWMAWVTNDSLAVAVDTSAVYVVGLDAAAWQRRIRDIAQNANSSLN